MHLRRGDGTPPGRDPVPCVPVPANPVPFESSPPPFEVALYWKPDAKARKNASSEESVGGLPRVPQTISASASRYCSSHGISKTRDFLRHGRLGWPGHLRRVGKRAWLRRLLHRSPRSRATERSNVFVNGRLQTQGASRLTVIRVSNASNCVV